MRRLMLGVILAVSGFAGSAVAQSSGAASAEALFGEGRKLMDAGKYADACPKFEASQRLDPGVGTMLNLAECYEKTGRTASAWAEFRAAIPAARAANSKEREDLARQRADSLEPTLSKLTIALGPEAAGTNGVQVKRDGVAVDSAELGSAIPVDPGKHVVEVTAPGKQSWSKSVDVGGNAAQLTVNVPALADGSAPPQQAGAVAGTAGSPTARSGSSQKTVAVVAGAVGVVGLAVGTVYGLRASSKWSDAKSSCTDFPYGCSKPGLADDAKKAGTLSTVGFVVGGVGLAAGAVLWFTAGPKNTESPQVGVGPGRILVKGRF